MSEPFEVEADRTGKPTAERCGHLDQLDTVAEPVGDRCEQCAEVAQTWNSLRACVSCGFVGCDDQSPGRHASRHWQESGHPVVRSMSASDTWAWCYEDELLLEPAGSARHREVPEPEENRIEMSGDINQKMAEAAGESEAGERPRP